MSLSDKIYGMIPTWLPNILNETKTGWIPNPKPRPDLTEYYFLGLIRKEDLVHGEYYLGSCRNADVARWDGKRQLFRHVRHKFGDSFEEDIPHPEDQDGYDIFVPVMKVEPAPGQKVYEGF